jgi:pantoate--beta-alanine ligase
MLIFKRIKDLQKHLKTYEKRGKTVGFVPTMGALHKGHISLIQKSKKRANLTVCSIFVNPTQFNDSADFDKYPSTISSDIEKLNDAECDVLFLPTVKEMYPSGLLNKTKIDFGFLAQTLEGEYRPGHFDGMAQIVEKLLQVVKPNWLFMGLKDYQQQLIVRKLIEKRKLKIKLVTVDTLREKGGLAMSSRNVRLNDEQRKLAVEISKTLKWLKEKVGNKQSTLQKIQEQAVKRLQGKGIEVEYFEIRNANTLKAAVAGSTKQLDNQKNRTAKRQKLIALAAVRIGTVRLIDNMWLD